MAGGYFDKPTGTEGVGSILKQLQNQVNALRGGAGIRSAILRGVALVFQNEDGETLGRWGTFGASQLSEHERSADIAEGATFRRPDGGVLFRAITFQSNDATEVFAGADIVDLRAPRMILASDQYEIYQLPSTGSSANLRVDTSTGVPILHIVSSAEKYKTDVAEADVDPEDVLKLVGRTWVDRTLIDRIEPGNHINRNIGFIAEELDALPSLRQFVNYDDDGNPDSIEYDRLTVALLAVLKDQQARLDNHEARLTAIEGGK